MHEENYRYGGSYYEDMNWRTGKRQKSLLRSLLYLMRDYLYMGSYLKSHCYYWFFLYISHISFILLIFLQAFIIAGGLLSIKHIDVSLHGITEYIGLICFIAGIAGNIGLLVFHLVKDELRLYTSPFMYFGYLFYVILCLCGLVMWLYDDNPFLQYENFWRGLFTLSPVSITPLLTCFIILINLHLIYLPFTRAIHYITRLFAFFKIRWDDEPNIKGSGLEKRILKALEQKITWSAPHIHTGKKWNEQFKMND
ncbi:MAG TPA: hypothetical protein PKW07_09985 [Syntrophorhabdaceae bacterium]|nr:hypothetical protein [Syntrophorhabdaceae bacterium]